MSPYQPFGSGGDERVRTDDPLLAKQVLSQLSYTPIKGSKALWRSFSRPTEPQKLNNDSLGTLLTHFHALTLKSEAFYRFVSP